MMTPKDPLPAGKVKHFFSAGHKNLDKIKLLLLEFPTLLYATQDPGSGGFETGLDGAGHAVKKDIANYLEKNTINGFIPKQKEGKDIN